jgi:hypothetical protein
MRLVTIEEVACLEKGSILYSKQSGRIFRLTTGLYHHKREGSSTYWYDATNLDDEVVRFDINSVIKSIGFIYHLEENEITLINL